MSFSLTYLMLKCFSSDIDSDISTVVTCWHEVSSILGFISNLKYFILSNSKSNYHEKLIFIKMEQKDGKIMELMWAFWFSL